MSKNLDAIIQTDEFKSLGKDGMRNCIKNLNRNHIKEESIFNGSIVCCQDDDPTRKNDFPELSN